VRGDKLWIGSTGTLGKNESSIVSRDEQFVKIIDSSGLVATTDFFHQFDEISKVFEVNLREGKRIFLPSGLNLINANSILILGEIEHEAAEWDHFKQKWLFTPRRVTKQKKDAATWNSISTNRAVFVDDNSRDLEILELGDLNKNFGFVGLRYIPGTNNQLVLALKTGLDKQGNQLSTLVVYNQAGMVVMPEITVAEGIYSGVEFL